MNFKLQKLCELIKAYGGILPTESTTAVGGYSSFPVNTPAPNTTYNNQGQSTEPAYPAKGTWRDKIVFGLKSFGGPVTAKELSNYILHAEKSDDMKYIDSTTAQYLSFLDKEKRINCDRDNRPYKYSLTS
ncbi:hypothetical protein F0919_05115 [Taibaiella lutea]|uniref:Uncharacterized protein n=1 Tax=Taibaiella lutea TaxID=2608001 RepID=A0A5M6CPY6_9BACT|nr:hypothetical protein F0919_05115 [Taibaiella lutea]